jgi:predicted DNA-binding ArsR family transcriptional regulator
MTRGGGMAKITVQIGYHYFVLDGSKAMQLLDTLQGAEVYETKWRSESEGGTSYHIYPQDVTSRKVEIGYLSDEQYKLYKLAGKPSE